MKRLVVMLAAACAALGLCAETQTIGAYTWSYETYDDHVSLVKGANQAAVSPKPTGSVTIPGELGGLPVTRIGQSAFYGCSDLESVTIPSTVNYIGKKSFEGCSKLKSLNLPYDVDTIEVDALSGCTSLMTLCLPDKYFGGSFIDAVVNLADCPAAMELRYCGRYNRDGGRTWWYYQNIYTKAGKLFSCRGTELKYIRSANAYGSMYTPSTLSIPSEITATDGSVFKVTSIGAFALYNTEATAVTIPDTVTNIAVNAFFHCPSLTSLSIPDSVKGLPDYAISDCASLATVRLPSRLSRERFPTRLFDRCPDNLSIIFFDSGTGAEYQATLDGALASVEPNGATSAKVPAGVTRIANEAFYECSDLTSVMIPSSVTNIGRAAFAYCSGLTSVAIPASVTSVGTWAFKGCSGLKSFTVAGDNPTYKSVNGLLLTKDGKTLVMQGVGGDVTIPSGVTAIGEYAFDGCDGLTGVTIPDGVTSIGQFAFNQCSGLTSVTIPAGVTSIGNSAFYGCTGLTSVTIPSSVTSIGNWAFEDCGNLTSVRLPKHFEGNLDPSVFANCSAGLTITYYGGLSDALYTLRFHRNDASDEKVETCDFGYGVETHLPSLKSLGWARRGCDFLGWATSRANADAGKVWKKDWAAVASPVAAGKTLDVYAVWALKPNSYAIQFIRNDGAGTWRTVGFNYGEKTRIPSVAKGLGWARRGYDFKGWALTTADANAGKVWKGDWAYVATPVKAGKVLTVYAVWELKPGYYQIRFNKNDGSGKWRTLGYACGVPTKLPSITALGWKREGHSFDFWASSKANADAGYRWRYSGETVSTAAAEGKTLSVYAVWDYDWPWEGGGPSTWD